MNKKKKNVIEQAQKLFIEQGYHATSIQDILKRSGVSKGTFYNYFSAKVELFKESFIMLQDEMRIERDKVLIDKNIAVMDVFAEQMYVIMSFNEEKKINELIEDGLASDDPDLICFIKELKKDFNKWVYHRFQQIFSADKQPYLVDATIVYLGVMQSMLSMRKIIDNSISIKEILRYSLSLVEEMVEKSSSEKICIFTSEEFEKIFPEGRGIKSDFSFNELTLATGHLKKMSEQNLQTDRDKHELVLELITFVQEELMQEEPRKFLVNSALTTLNNIVQLNQTNEYKRYTQILNDLGYAAI
jgi:AcrR family transcriptional regulator